MNVSVPSERDFNSLAAHMNESLLLLARRGLDTDERVSYTEANVSALRATVAKLAARLDALEGK